MDILEIYLCRNQNKFTKKSNLFTAPVPGSDEKIFQDIVGQQVYSSGVRSDYVPLNIEKMLGMPEIDKHQFVFKQIDPLESAGGLAPVFEAKLTAPPSVTEEAIRAAEKNQPPKADVGEELDKLMGVQKPQGVQFAANQQPQPAGQQPQGQPGDQQPQQPKPEQQPVPNQPQVMGIDPKKMQEIAQALQQGDVNKVMVSMKDFAATNPALVAGIVNQFLPWENNPLSVFMALGLAALSKGDDTFQAFLQVMGIAFGAGEQQQNPAPAKK